MPAYDTDNMGKLFDTFFAFAPALKTNLYWLLHPVTHNCQQFESRTMTDFWLRDNSYDDTAPVPIYQLPATETAFWPFINLVPQYT